MHPTSLKMVLNIHVYILTIILLYFLFCCFVALLPFIINIDTQLKEVHYLVPNSSSFSVSRGMCENSRGENIVFDMKSNELVDMTFIKTEVKVTVKESDRISRPQAICIRETDVQILVACL